ncbi:chemotaxis protein CheW [Rubritepida flocculans]
MQQMEIQRGMARPGVGPAGDAAQMVLTLTVAGQLCGVPVLAVRDVLGVQSITPIPLAPREVAGSLNLRGRIVTAVDLRVRLGLAPAGEAKGAMSVVVEIGGELYSLLADAVGEVLSLDPAERAANPPTLDPAWREVSLGVHRLGEQLLVLLDVERLLVLSS